jgi:hypothetical protein
MLNETPLDFFSSSGFLLQLIKWSHHWRSPAPFRELTSPKTSQNNFSFIFSLSPSSENRESSENTFSLPYKGVKPVFSPAVKGNHPNSKHFIVCAMGRTKKAKVYSGFTYFPVLLSIWGLQLLVIEISGWINPRPLKLVEREKIERKGNREVA